MPNITQGYASSSALIVTGLLAWEFKSPLLILVVILLQTHALQRFEDSGPDDDDEDDFPARPMGFTADIK
jgi:hypothetical protein